MNCEVCTTKVSSGSARYGDNDTIFCKKCFGTDDAQNIIEASYKSLKRKPEFTKKELLKRTEDSSIKLKIIFIPYLITFITIISTYTFLRWLLDIELDAFSANDEIFEFYIPFAISFVVLPLLMRKRVRFLTTKKGKEFGSFLLFIMSVALLIPLSVLQVVITTSPYNLIELNNESEIVKFSEEKYFNISTFDIQPNSALYDTQVRVEGRHGESLKTNLYITVPMNRNLNIWHGIFFRHSMSNRATDIEKEDEYKKFIDRSNKEFQEYDYTKAQYFELLTKSEFRENFLRVIRKKHSFSSEAYVLLPRYHKFEQRAAATYDFFIMISILGAIIVFAFLKMPIVDEQKLKEYKTNKYPKDDFSSKVINIFIFKAGCPATTVLVNLTIIIFIYCTFIGINPFYPSANKLLEIGGVKRDLVLQGEYWRLMSAVFIHAGIAHLFLNVMCLCIFGPMLERFIGSFKYILVFLISGIMGSVASITWYESTVSIGASGAIYGALGALIVLAYYEVLDKPSRSIVWVLAFSLISTGVAMGLFLNIDNAAHFGGLLAGMFIARIMVIKMNKADLQI